MDVPSISHTFYDFEVEQVAYPSDVSPKEIYLVKVLSIDGRRFTYEIRSALTSEAVSYIKSLIDAVVFSDMVIERTAEGFEAQEATTRLKKHS
jgi:hypothetical protein